MYCNYDRHKDWYLFILEEKKLTENTVLLVGLLYNMCKVELVLKYNKKDGMNKINKEDIKNSISNAKSILEDKFN